MKKPHILIIEDEAPVNEVMRIALERAGYKITVAERMSAAMDALDADKYDAIVIDGNLGGMTGYETRPVIERALKLQSSPFIIAASSNSMTRREMISDGCTHMCFDDNKSDVIIRIFELVPIPKEE